MNQTGKAITQEIFSIHRNGETSFICLQVESQTPTTADTNVAQDISCQDVKTGSKRDLRHYNTHKYATDCSLLPNTLCA